ncbi:MAG: TMEM175 family protein [Devosia sp.]
MARKPKTDWQTPERISSFVDGVLFVAMTILILTVDLPDLTKGADGVQLLSELSAVVPNVFAYCASFIVIALYWMGFNTHFQDLERIDSTLMWLIILFLLLIGFVPFATSLMGEHDAFVATALYSSVMIAIAGILLAMSAYARRKGLFSAAAAEEPWLPSVVPWLKNIAVFGVSIVVAALWPEYGRLSYLLLAIPDGLFGRLIGIPPVAKTK